jgi:hypothetical protein
MIKNDPKNIWWFIQGYYRWFLKDTFLVRGFIKEQFQERLNTTEKKCLEQGSCIMCSCTTPQLLYANKPCSKSKISKETRIMLFGKPEVCFTQMLSKKEWSAKQLQVLIEEIVNTKIKINQIEIKTKC